MLSKIREAKETLILSNAFLRTQVQNLEQICLDTKVQSKITKEELEINYGETNKFLQLEVESLNQQLLKITCQRDTLIISNNTFKNQILILEKKLEKYVQSNKECVNEVGSNIKCLSNHAIIFEHELINLNTMLNNGIVDSNTNQMRIHKDLQQCKLQNFNIFIAIFQKIYKIICENENKKFDKNTIKLVKPIFNGVSNYKNISSYGRCSNIVKKYHFLENNQQLPILNMDMEKETCGVHFITKTTPMSNHKEVALHLKFKSNRKIYKKNERNQIHSNVLNFTIMKAKNIQRNKFYLRNKNKNIEECNSIIQKLWLTCNVNKITNTIQIKRKQKIEKISEELHNIVVVMNDFIFNINQDIKFYNKVCNWNFEMNPCIWNPGI
jgi:hypothetical protein